MSRYLWLAIIILFLFVFVVGFFPFVLVGVFARAVWVATTFGWIWFGKFLNYVTE